MKNVNINKVEDIAISNCEDVNKNLESLNKISMIPGEIFKDVNGTYMIIYNTNTNQSNEELNTNLDNSESSYSVNFPDGTSQTLNFPPGYSCVKIDDIPDEKYKILKECDQKLQDAFKNDNNNPFNNNDKIQRQFDEYMKQLGKSEVGTDNNNISSNNNNNNNNKFKSIYIPERLSYEGSTMLCVMLAGKDCPSIPLYKFPNKDQHTIQNILQKYFSLECDSNIRFNISLDTNENFKFYNDKFTFTMINSVYNLSKEDIKELSSVKIKDDGNNVYINKLKFDKQRIRRLVNPNCKLENSNIKCDNNNNNNDNNDNNDTSYNINNINNNLSVRERVLDKAISIVNKSSIKNESPDVITENIIKISKELYKFINS